MNDFIATRYGTHVGKYVPSENTVILVVGSVLADVYLVFRPTLGAEKTERFFSTLRDRLLRVARL